MNNQCWRVTRLEKATFFSLFDESDVHLAFAHYADGTGFGKVTDDAGNILSIGPLARGFFFGKQSHEEMHYAILRSKIKAMTGFPDWQQDKPANGSVTE